MTEIFQFCDSRPGFFFSLVISYCEIRVVRNPCHTPIANVIALFLENLSIFFHGFAYLRTKWKLTEHLYFTLEAKLFLQSLHIGVLSIAIM